MLVGGIWVGCAVRVGKAGGVLQALIAAMQISR